MILPCDAPSPPQPPSGVALKMVGASHIVCTPPGENSKPAVWLADQGEAYLMPT